MNTRRFVVVVALLIVVTTITTYAMPPHPELLDRIRNGEVSEPYYLENEAELRTQGVNAPGPNTFLLSSGSQLDETDFNTLLLMIDFSDNTSSVAEAYFDSLMYGSTTGKVKHFYQEVSYGDLTIMTGDYPSDVGWLRLPQTYAYYVDGQNGYGTYPQNVKRMVEDALTLADPAVDFSIYDNDSDGYIDGLMLVHAGPGAEYTGSDDDIWSHKWSISPMLLDGVYAYIYSIQPEYWSGPGDMTCGVFCHEMGHGIFGLPDVYDRDGSSEGVGNFSLMAGGSWNGSLGSSPSHPDAWNRIQMGFVEPTVLTTNQTGVEIPSVITSPTIYKLWTDGDVSGDEYFLVENRGLEGYDTAIPGWGGLLIWHIDDGVFTQNDNEWYPGYTDNGHYLVALEQADGLWEMEQDNGRGNSGDPFPGGTSNTAFNATSTPNSTDYNFNETLVAIENISDAALTMTADITVTDAITPESPRDLVADLDTENGVVSLSWLHGPAWGVDTELAYDDGTFEGSYNWNGGVMGSQMSPLGNCRLVRLRYRVSGSPGFTAGVYPMAGSTPSTTPLYEMPVTVAEDGWMDIDVSEENMTFDSDFVVAFGGTDATTAIAYNSTGNGRAWDNSGSSWSSYSETYLIRAVVQYEDGSEVVLGGTGAELDEFTNFNIYRNENLIGTTTDQNYDDTLDNGGQFDYYVTALYDEGESSPSNTVSVTYGNNVPPGDFALVEPVNGAMIADNSSVTLRWLTSVDPDSDPVTYNVECSLNADFSGTNFTATTSDTFLVINNLDATAMFIQGKHRVGDTVQLDDLPDDSVIYWRVTASDGNNPPLYALPGSDGWSFNVYVPEAPAAFSLTSPSDGYLCDSESIQLTWAEATDPDPGDAVSYVVYLSTDVDFGSVDSVEVATLNYTFSYVIPGMTYYWKVRAQDSNTHGTWSTETWSFEGPFYHSPNSFTLYSPEDEVILDTLSYTFEWEESHDSDVGDRVNYHLALSTRNDFNDSLTVYYHTGEDSIWIVPYMLDDTDYWWRVTAIDLDGHTTLSDVAWSFHTAYPEPPHPFELDEGGLEMNAVGDSIVVTLSWHRTWDPDPESLESYKVLLDTTEDMDSPIVLADNIEVSGSDSTFTWTKTYAPEELPMLGDGYWTVFAYDDNTEGTWADQPQPIFMTSVENSPWGSVPTEYEIASVYPNPFNPTLTAVISLPQSSDLTVQVFNVMGQRVATIAEGHYQEGFHSLVFNGTGMASGVYFIHASVPGKMNQVQKVILMK